MKYREAAISRHWNEELHQYITAVVQNLGHKMLRIYAMPDHLHLFFGFQPNQSLSDLIRVVKSDSSKWINQQNFTRRLFRWQEGYAAFSYSRSQVAAVAAYVQNQEEHHKKFDFDTEYRSLLDEFEIPYDPKYLFKPLE